jgi:hypothetical protein
LKAFILSTLMNEGDESFSASDYCVVRNSNILDVTHQNPILSEELHGDISVNVFSIPIISSFRRERCQLHSLTKLLVFL